MNIIKFHTLETDRLVLRRFREADAEEFFKYRTQPETALYQSEKWDHYTFDQAAAFVKEQMNSEPGIPDSWFQIAIECKETGNLIGDCAIHTLLQDVNQAEIGFTLDLRYRSKGFGIEAVKCLLKYLFHELDIHRVIAVTDTRNHASVRLLEKIGMRREGHFIKNEYCRGEYIDEYLYALLKEEWQRC